MEKTLDMKLTGNKAAQIAATIAKCDQGLRWLFRQMRKDQAEIERLKAQTRAILAEIKDA